MNKGKNLLLNLLILFFLFLGSNLKAQVLESDSTLTKEVPAEAEEIHSPKKAAIYSAILPGLGQAYNKKYWKIPIVYAGFGTIGYFIGWNNRNYSKMKQARIDLNTGDPNEGSHVDILPPGNDYSDPTTLKNANTALTRQRDYYRRNRDLLIISMVGFYGLNIIDASVDAHLFNFDISDDLAFDWQPSVQNTDNQLVYGFNCKFNF